MCGVMCGVRPFGGWCVIWVLQRLGQTLWGLGCLGQTLWGLVCNLGIAAFGSDPE